MKIRSIKFIEHFRPNCSCGTGYSEPDKFHVICDTGYETDIWVDIWYRPMTSYRQEFYDGLFRVFQEGSIENLQVAFGMYLDELIHSKQYSITNKDKYEMMSLGY